MNIARRNIALLLIVTALGACTRTQSPDEPALNEVRAQLAPTGTLRAAINHNNPFLARRDPGTGELSGPAVDLARELARRVGVPVELIPYDAAGKISNAAAKNEWDVAFLAIDPERAREIDFSGPHVEVEGTYLVPPGSPFERAEEVDRPGVRIAVTARSAYDLFLTRELKHAQLVRADNTPDSFRLLFDQNLDAAAGLRTALVAESRKRPGSRVLSGRFMTIPQAAGVPAGRPAAARYVHDFIEEMKASGFIAEALKRHGIGPDEAVVAGPTARR